MRYARELLTVVAKGPISVEAALKLYPDSGAYQNGMMDAITTDCVKLFAADGKEVETWQWLATVRNTKDAAKFNVVITDKGQEYLREMGEAPRYRFHTHKTMPLWRLVTREDLGFPTETTSDAWAIMREREESDTNSDVRDEIAAHGYCLFKIGASFGELEAEMRGRL